METTLWEINELNWKWKLDVEKEGKKVLKILDILAKQTFGRGKTRYRNGLVAKRSLG